MISIQQELDRLFPGSYAIFMEALQRWHRLVIITVNKDLSKFYKSSSTQITATLTDWEYLNEQGQEILKPATLSIFQRAGKQAYKLVGVKGAFDVVNRDAITAAEKFTADLVTNVTKQTKAGIRTHITTGIGQGQSMPNVAKSLKNVVGLNARQVTALENRRILLETADKYSHLNKKQIKQRLTNYSAKLHRSRLRSIARTETARAQTIGYAKGLANVGVEQVEFSMSPDACPDCEALHGTRYSIADGALMIPVHPHCHCALIPVIGGLPVAQDYPGEINASALPPIPDNVPDLLELLGTKPDKKTQMRIRRALRKLGHKGGLKGPGVAPIPKPVTVRPKPKPKPSVPAGGELEPSLKGPTKFKTAEGYRQEVLRVGKGGDKASRELLEKFEAVQEKKRKYHQAMESKRKIWRKAFVESNAESVNKSPASVKKLYREYQAARDELMTVERQWWKIKDQLKVTKEEMRAALFEKKNLKGTINVTKSLDEFFNDATKSQLKKWQTVTDDLFSMVPAREKTPGVSHIVINSRARTSSTLGEYSHRFNNLTMFSKSSQVYAHEFGHHLGYKLKGGMKKQNTFFKNRTVGEKKGSLPGFRGEIQGKRDKFGKVSYYAGRVYKDGRSPELISVGIEYLWNHPVSFAKKDPEWFNMVISVLKGFPYP
jgi:SPP1 gp7 family putative phage head morphogenesis protein